jgi:SAM-dependent methyltransferase
MNSAAGKAILAKARDGDFAHPGEEEAVRLVAQGLTKSPRNRVLDVGCGRGGTAAWFQRNNFGRVFGIDVDSESIQYARSTYPEVTFCPLDVAQLKKKWDSKAFDLVYLFNSYYAFRDQPGALREIRDVCRSGAELYIFDYARSNGAVIPAALGTEIGHPIVIETITRWLAAAGWVNVISEDWTERFIFWYGTLLAAFERERVWVTENFGIRWAEFVTHFYGSLRESLLAGDIRGAVLHAIAD